jgi:predicted dehydrogenase
MKSKSPVTLIIAGAGDRGATYANYPKAFPKQAKVVGIAEPRAYHRKALATAHQIPAASTFTDWREMAAQPRFADAVIIAVQDAMHVEAAVAFANRGYHILLEKPMATSAAGCRRIIAATQKNNVILSVCHVLRYTAYTRALKRVIDSGAIGDIVTLQHLEPVGWWHQAHSFVRGNWRNTAESTFMLLAKSCHDLDWISHIMGRPCSKVASFGSLHHFRPENRPAGAADRCLDCQVEKECPYSAQKIYLGFLEKGTTGWPVNVIAPEPTPAKVLKALKTGPYGRCVYACDNDVVDNQVVILEFDNGSTANFTMTAFTPSGGRRTHICGTRGHIYGDSTTFSVLDFRTGKTTEHDPRQEDQAVLAGHGGGDNGVIENFVAAVAANNPDLVLSGPKATLESHLMVFAAEKARLRGQVVRMES